MPPSTREFDIIASPGRSGSGKPNILVVDDDPDVRTSLCDLLVDAGYDVVCKKDGAEALAHLRKQRAPAAILLDLFMPNVNGWEFVKQLKLIRKLAGVPIIMVTGTSPLWGYPVPDHMVIRKPIDPQRLLQTLALAVGRAPSVSAAG